MTGCVYIQLHGRRGTFVVKVQAEFVFILIPHLDWVLGEQVTFRAGPGMMVTFHLDTWVQFIQHWQMIWWVPLLGLCCLEVLGTN